MIVNCNISTFVGDRKRDLIRTNHLLTSTASNYVNGALERVCGVPGTFTVKVGNIINIGAFY